jgi:3-dehydroquinate synthase
MPLSPSRSRTSPIRIDVAASSGLYPVFVGAGALGGLSALLDQAAIGPDRVLVSSPLVWQLHGDTLRRTIKSEPILVPDGERSKTLATVGRVYDALLQRRADRATALIAFGGGVIGDLVGFAAATFLRGLSLVQVPTTVMAQVDSAIGGKVGVNHPQGKNLIGAFHSPRAVIADPLVLKTLPRREFRAGLYEVVKYGVIADPTLIDRVTGELPAIFSRESAIVTDIVAESCRIKARIVAADERESGLRRVLNFGHTIGHALEAVTRYRRYRHGEAVAYGMLAALALGAARGVTPTAVRDRVSSLITKLGPLPPVGDLASREILAAVGHDKKVVARHLHFVAATALGSTTTLTDVTERELRDALRTIGVKK